MTILPYFNTARMSNIVICGIFEKSRLRTGAGGVPDSTTVVVLFVGAAFGAILLVGVFVFFIFLVSVHVAFVRSVNIHADVIGLAFGEGREFGAEVVEVEAGDFFVEFFVDDVNAD